MRIIPVPLLFFLSVFLTVWAIPASYEIKGVPYHRQVTDYACGDASFQMVMGYYGLNLTQYAIMDVLRTSESSGTYSMDIVRGGQFSFLSDAQGSQYPSYIPRGGWDHQHQPHRKGFAAFGYRQMFCWLDQLKAVIAQNIPAILLMEFGDVPFDGHYRVLVGYDDTTRCVKLLDPWDRDQPKVMHYSYEVFCGLWAYPEINGNITSDPNFAAIVVPWNVKVSFHAKSNQRTGTVVAEVHYPCPSPFCNASANPHDQPFVARQAVAQLTLPPNLVLKNRAHNSNNLNNNNNATFFIGDLYPGKYALAKWDVEIMAGVVPSGPIVVDAWGTISGKLPQVLKGNATNVWYPPYHYQDVIGGSGSYK